MSIQRVIILGTPLGGLYLDSDHPFDYTIKSILNRKYKVTQRYEVKVTLKESSASQFMACGLFPRKGLELSSGPSIGQKLAAIQIEGGLTDMHIGTFGEVEGLDDRYSEHVLRIEGEPNSEFREFVFYVAWLTFKTEINIDNKETWLAVDPYTDYYYSDYQLCP